MQNFFFALEIEIDRAVRDARCGGDVRDLRIKISVAGKDAGGRAQNRLALAGGAISLGFSGHHLN